MLSRWVGKSIAIGQGVVSSRKSFRDFKNPNFLKDTVGELEEGFTSILTNYIFIILACPLKIFSRCLIKIVDKVESFIPQIILTVDMP
jgi:hypothetical protein